MNLKMAFVATLSVALLAISADAEIIHESDFETESTTGFGVGTETMPFNDAGGDMIGFSNSGGSGTSGDSLGVTAANPNSGSFSYVNDVGATSATTGLGWGAAWCGANTDSGGSGGFTSQAVAEENGSGCYVDISAGATFTATCQIATDPLNPLTGTATGEVRLEFNHVFDNGDGTTGQVNDVAPRQISARLGAADLTADYQELTISYTLTQAEIDAAEANGTPINSVAGVMGIENAGHGSSSGHILFDDFVFEVNSENVVLVGDGHDTDTTLKGDVDLNGAVNFSDIPAFISVLQAGGDQAEADCDCSGAVDFSDIPAFIAILQGS